VQQLAGKRRRANNRPSLSSNLGKTFVDKKRAGLDIATAINWLG